MSNAGIHDRSVDAARREECGVFLRIPPRIAAGFPKTKDDSPVHATLCIVGEATRDEFQGIIQAVRSVAMQAGPFQVEMTDYGEFETPGGEVIPHMIPRTSGGSLDDLHGKVRSAVESALGRKVDHFVGPFKPHVTLGYQAKGTKYDGPRPTGAWKAKALEVWGAKGGEFGRSAIELGTGAVLRHVSSSKDDVGIGDLASGGGALVPAQGGRKPNKFIRSPMGISPATKEVHVDKDDLRSIFSIFSKDSTDEELQKVADILNAKRMKERGGEPGKLYPNDEVEDKLPFVATNAVPEVTMRAKGDESGTFDGLAAGLKERPGDPEFDEKLTVEKACDRGMTVQTVIFPKTRFDRDRASKWLRSHGRSSEIDETEDSYRARQKDPGSFEEGSLRTISLGSGGIKAVVGCPKTEKAQAPFPKKKPDGKHLFGDSGAGPGGAVSTGSAGGSGTEGSTGSGGVGMIHPPGMVEKDLEVPQDAEPPGKRGDLGVRILKREEDEEQRTVFGVVLEPETVDSQNDIYSVNEVRETAWRFAERHLQFGLMHRQIVPGVLLLETYLAPVSFECEGQKVKKGSWLLRVRILDDQIWEACKRGDLGSFSIGGSAMRRPE